MTRITWDRDASRFFELGVDQGVLYSPGRVGVPWSGLVSVKTSIAGGESTAKHQDGIKLAVRIAGDEFSGSIDAYTYPDEFAEHDGTMEIFDGLFVTQQVRRPFSFTYRTLVGSDTLGSEAGYKLHILYSIVAKPSNRDHNSVSESETPSTFSWPIEGIPVRVPGYKPSTHLILDSRYVPADLMKQIEDILYGTSSRAPRLPNPQEIMSLFGDTSDLIVVDLGDGTFTAEGPTVTIRSLESFTIDHASVTDNGDGSFDIEYEPV